jgi:hypothetical protein
LHARGHRFDSDILHKIKKTIMNHPLDKKTKQKKTPTDYDSYFLMMGYKDINRVVDKNKQRDRYGAKERKRIKAEKEYREINGCL